MKKIVVITGHPDPDSFCSALSQAYINSARGQAAEIRHIDLSKLSFGLNLKYGYRQRTELEDELQEAQRSIAWADHLVLIYPTWWGTMPAVLKGFFDRVFLPGFAYKYRQNSKLWDKLLKGKTARLIVTMDTPSWFNRLVYQQAGHIVMKRNILQFCGVKPVRITQFCGVAYTDKAKRELWLQRVSKLGSQLR